MSEFKKNVEEKLDELKEQAELAKEGLEEKFSDSKDKTGAALDNAKKAFGENMDELKLQATLAKENAAEKISEWKEKAEPAIDNALKNAKNKVGDLAEDFKNSEYGQKILGEDGKLDMEDVKRIASDVREKVEGVFKKDEE